MWTIGLGGRCIVSTAAGDKFIMDVDKEKDGESQCTCGDKDKSAHNCKGGKDKDGYDSDMIMERIDF